MPRVFHSNFGFETELAAPAKSAGATLLRRSAELSYLWMAMADENDIVVAPPTDDDEFLSALTAAGLEPASVIEDIRRAPKTHEFTPWGWSEPALAVAKSAHQPCRPPRLDVVRKANRRRFSLELETEWNCGLPGACVVRTVDEFRDSIRNPTLVDGHWIAKAEFGMAGRERIVGKGPDVTESNLNWVAKRLAKNQAIVVEPRVNIIAETGIQIEIPRNGDPQLLGITPFIAARTGEFLGCWFDESVDRDEWNDAIEVAMRAAGRIQHSGYFGPLGIDAVRYHDADGNLKLRALQDINARYTMGRLSLGLRRILRPGESGTWLHGRHVAPSPSHEATTYEGPPRPSRQLPSADSTGLEARRTDRERAASDYEQFVTTLPEGVRAVRTSPFTAAGSPVQHTTVALIADDASLLEDVMRIRGI